MNPDIALRSVLALFALWIAVFYLWRDFRNDAFRDHLFSIRDRMFLYAAQDHIDFDAPAYTILRNRMNLLLRHGHEFTLTRAILIGLTHSSDVKPDALVRWEEAVELLPEKETQEKMKEFNSCVLIAVLQQVIFCSFFRYIALRPLMFLIHFRRVVQSPKVASGMEQLEGETQEQESRLLSRAATA